MSSFARGWHILALLICLATWAALASARADDMTERPARRAVRLIALEHRDAAAVRDALRALPVRITADPESNRLLVLGSGEDLEQLERLVRELDVPIARKPDQPALELKVYRLRHRSPDELAACLTPMLSERGKLAADAGSRSLVVKDEPSAHAELATIIRELDIPVAACPLDLSPQPTAARTAGALEGEPLLGVAVPQSPSAATPTGTHLNLQLKICEVNRIGYCLGPTPSTDRLEDTPPYDNALATELLAGDTFCSAFGPFDHEAWLRAMSERGLLKVVAEPTLVVQSGRSANFFKQVGQYAEPLVTDDESADSVVQVPGLRADLRFLATVCGPEHVRLETVSPFSSGFESASESPHISVELCRGQLLAMCGMVTERAAAPRASGVDKVPVLGQLVRSARATTKRTELLILAIPQISSPRDPAGIALEPTGVRRE
jgi:hypothetical protein